MKKIWRNCIPLVLMALLLVACGGGSGSSPLSHIDEESTGPGGVGDEDSAPISVWSEDISTDPVILRYNPIFNFQLFSSPAIAADGTIYVGSTNGVLYAFYPNGDFKWGYPTGDQIVASPAVGDDGTVYVGSADRQLYAIYPDGTLKWVFPTKAVLTSSPALGADGTIYVAGTYLDRTLICSDSSITVQLGTFFALNPDGMLKWSIFLSGPVNSSPVIASDGTIYIGSAGDEVYDRFNPCDPTSEIPPSYADSSYPVNGHVYAINPDGFLKWDFGTLGEVHSSAAIAADGTIYIGSDHIEWYYVDDFEVKAFGSNTTGFLYAINPDGTLIWFTDLFGDVKSSPAIGSDGTIYVGTDKEDVFALNPDGSIRWVFPTRGPVRSSPALASDGTIFIGSNDSRLYALNPDGTLEFEYFANAAIASSPSIIGNGTVYFATGVPVPMPSDVPYVDGDATLYSIIGTTGLAETDWPKFRRDHRNTGRQ